MSWWWCHDDVIISSLHHWKTMKLTSMIIKSTNTYSKCRLIHLHIIFLQYFAFFECSKIYYFRIWETNQMLTPILISDWFSPVQNNLIPGWVSCWPGCIFVCSWLVGLKPCYWINSGAWNIAVYWLVWNWNIAVTWDLAVNWLAWNLAIDGWSLETLLLTGLKV